MQAPKPEPSTKQAATLLGDWGVDGSVLVVLADAEVQAALSFRNIDRVSVLPAQAAGVADVVGAASLLVSQAALDALSARAIGIAPVRPEPAPDREPEPEA